MVHRDPLPASQRVRRVRQHLHLALQPVSRRQAARRGQRVTSRHLVAVDAHQRHRHPLPGRGCLHRRVVHLHAPHPHLAPARHDRQPVAGAHRARPQRPRHDRADPAQRERPVDRQPHRPLVSASLRQRRHPVELGQQLRQTLSGARRHLHDRRVSHQLLDAHPRQRRRLVVHQVSLGQRHDSQPQPQHPQDRQMLARLRHHAVVAGHHQQVHVDPGRPRHHRAHEPLVPRHIDHRQPAPRRQLQRRVPELDRDAARPFLRQPVGVDPGQRRDQRRLAVVDVAGRAHGQRRVGHSRIRSQSSSLSVRQSSSTRPSCTRAITGGSPSRSRAASSSPPSSAQAKLSSSSNGSAPASHLRRRLGQLAAQPPAEPLGPLPHPLGRLPQRPQHRYLGQRLRGIPVQLQRRLERRQRQLVDPHRARQRVTLHPSHGLGGAHDDPRLRPAQQLVPGEADQVGARLDAGPRRGLVQQVRQVEQRAGAEVVDQRHVSARQLRQLLQPGVGREPDDPEVRLVHPQDRPRLARDRLAIVRDAGAVRGADLHQPRARLGEDVGDPEPVADLDQLTAADQHLAAARGRREAQQHGRRVVVHGQPRLRARQARQQDGEVVVPRAATPRRQVVLERRVAGRHLAHPLDRNLRQRRPAQVGVDDHAGRVQHRTQAGRPSQPPRRRLQQTFLSGNLPRRTRFRKHVAQRRHHRLPSVLVDQRLARAGAQQGVHRGQVA